MDKIKTEDLYYHGIAKSCLNCFYRSKTIFTLSKCNKYPTRLSDASLQICQYKEWQPNQKLYDKYKGTE